MQEDSNSKTKPFELSNRGWRRKFSVAFGGMLVGIKGPRGPSGPNSFMEHVPCAIVVIAAGLLLNLDWGSLAILLLCIGCVFVSELFNSSIEQLAKAVTKESNEHVRAALDIASGAVLVASLTAFIVGALIFGQRLL